MSAKYCFLIVAAVAALNIDAASVMSAADPRVDWGGRVKVDKSSGRVSFDWLGVTARVQVKGATFVAANITSTAVRGTRMRVWASDQNFDLYPVSFFVRRPS